MERLFILLLALISTSSAFALDWHVGAKGYLVAATPRHILFLAKDDDRFKGVQSPNEIGEYQAKLQSGVVFAWALEGYSESHVDLLNAPESALNKLQAEFPLRNYLYDLGTGISEEIGLPRFFQVDNPQSRQPLRNRPKLSTRAFLVNKTYGNYPFLKVRLSAVGGSHFYVDYCSEMPQRSQGRVTTLYQTSHTEIIHAKLPLPFKRIKVQDLVLAKLAELGRTQYPKVQFFETIHGEQRLSDDLWPHIYPIEIGSGSIVFQGYLRDYSGVVSSAGARFNVKKKMKLTFAAGQEPTLSVVE